MTTNDTTHITNMFGISDEQLNVYNDRSTNIIKGYWNGNMNNVTKEVFYYLYLLDDNLDEYVQFCADKVNMSNINNFFNELNITITKQNKKADPKGRYTLYSDNNEITITFSQVHAFRNGYMHYFGATGSKKAISHAFKIFAQYASYDELCYGVRKFV